MTRSVVAAAVAAALLSCGPSSPTCSAAAAGLGDHVVTTRALPGRAATANVTCNPRVDVVRNDADLQARYASLGLGAPPAVDFAKEVVVVREAASGSGIQWVAAKDDLVTVGTQGCLGADESMCEDDVLAVPAPAVTRGVEHSCAAARCGYDQTQ